MFICRIAYSEVHIINHSSVKTSNFIHFTKPSDVLTCKVPTELRGAKQKRVPGIFLGG